MTDPDLQIREGGHPDTEIRGGGGGRGGVSVWSKNKGSGLPEASPLDPQLHNVIPEKLCIYFTLSLNANRSSFQKTISIKRKLLKEVTGERIPETHKGFSTPYEFLRILNKVLYGEAPPRGPTPDPFICRF